MPQDDSARAAICRRQPNTGRKPLRVLAAGLFLLALCATIRYYWGAAAANADPADRQAASAEGATTATIREADPSERVASRSSRSTPPRTDPAGRESMERPRDGCVPAIVATVNNQRIAREDLAKDCLRHCGKEVLESMVNKMLIAEECHRQGITVTRREVDAEIQRMSKRFNIPVDQWLKMLKQERNVTPEQYANDIIWPTLALRKLAGGRLTITREELYDEFETQYGDMVRARLISVGNPQMAEKLRAQAAANAKNPDHFGNLAKNYSEDATSASTKGVINPIRKHGTYPEIENVVFRMHDGDISPVIHVGEQYVIIKREGLIPARDVKFERVAPQLEEVLRDRRMRDMAQDIFRELQAKTKVYNVWNDAAQQARMPGVAAVVNNTQITIRELAEECIARHGQEILEGAIGRKLLEQACRRQNVAVTAADIDQEIARLALAGVKAKPDGSADVDAWLEMVTQKQNTSIDVYRNDMIWPSVALQKLAGNKVVITDDDLRKGFEANYGPRVRCLAIVMNNQRRAQQVFELARKQNTSENFGELAAQYSIEPGSQALRGEVPPIKKFGGQPELEREAFALKPGELSGIIQVDDKFILLRCEGFTEPVANVKFAAVRDDIYHDLYEKKLRLAMGDCFEKLQESAVIDNYLAGTSHAPKSTSGGPPMQPAGSSGGRTPANLPTLRQVPAG
jgi:parvulin-like peptidyl-prolyl isomerase